MSDSQLPSAPLTKAQLPDIIRRYYNGESMQTLAKEAQTNRATLYRWMLSGIGDQDYEELITGCLINRIVESDEKLETAPDSCNIARAREMARFSRMDLERRRPHLYGPKTEVKQDTQITVIVHREIVISLT